MATPSNISEYRGRYPLTRFSYDDISAPVGVVLGTINQYENVTANLAVQSLTDEAGFALNTDTAGNEYVESQFPGPTLVTAHMTVSSGIPTEGTFLGLLVDGSFVPGPVVLATIPDNRTDVGTQDGVEKLRVSWLVENARAPNSETGQAGTKFQVALASSAATTVNIIKAELSCERMSAALNDA